MKGKGRRRAERKGKGTLEKGTFNYLGKGLEDCTMGRKTGKGRLYKGKGGLREAREDY